MGCAVSVSTVSLSHAGISLILAEQELHNLSAERVRLLARCREADAALRRNTEQIREADKRVQSIKESL